LRVLLNFRSGFAGLREGFEALGHEVVENRWAADVAGIDLCVGDFVDCTRNLRRTLSHARALRSARVPFIALNRDARWHRGVHPFRLGLVSALAPLDGYATNSQQEGPRFSRRTLYCPNAARESVYRVTLEDLVAMRDPA